MKKNIFLTLALSLAFAATAWGQATEPFTASITNTPTTYNGEPQSPSITANCAYSHTFAAVTDAGTYQVTVNNGCTTHDVGSGTLTHTGGSVTLDFVIDPHNIADATFVTTVNANDMKWTGATLTPTQGDGDEKYQLKATIAGNPTDLELNTDYTFYTIPSEVKDAGEYTIVFVGKGNYNGTVATTFNVKKDLTDPSVEAILGYDIPTQIIPFESQLKALNMIITDENSHETLYEGVDYTLKYYQADGTTEITDFTTNGLAYSTDGIENKYQVEIIGQGTKYNQSVKKVFYAVKEYQTLSPTDGTANISLHITEPGYPEAETSPTGVVVIGKMMVGAKAAAAVDAAAERVKIPATHTVSVTKDITFNIAGIENGAFKGCNTLRYIDATNLEGYTPSSLDRKAENTPFEGLPKQTLVFLEGATVTGENYIYKTTTAGDYRCETLMIYDDVNGTQTGFENANAAMWGFMNPIEFKANTVTNTRILTAKEVTNTVTYTNVKQQAYTTCLPYELPLPKGLKAYALSYSKTDQIGFTEVTANTLTAMTPYLIIPSSSGQMLSTTNADIEKTYEATNDPATCKYVDITPTTSQATGTETRYDLKGTMAYLSGAAGMYIMQSNNVWAAVSGASDYPNPCVLPMRAYIEAYVAPARLYTIFNNADGSTTGIANLQIDADTQAEVYDLQGRKVAAPQRGGLYIVNGKKMLMK